MRIVKYELQKLFTGEEFLEFSETSYQNSSLMA